MGDENKDEPPQWSHMLVNNGYLEDVQQPILASSRIRYTCISVSKKFIALGSSTGVVHIFLRESLRYVQLIAGDKDGAVVKIEIGPDESTVGFATSKGMVYVYLLKMERRAKPEKLRSTNDHRGAVVTSLVWNDQGNRLFVGDDFGKVTAVNIVSGAKDIFKTPSVLVMKLDKPIVQIDSFKELMLVSTTERTYIGNSSKQQYTHIGSKLRDGHFGACFWRPVTSGGEAMIYCSRPGSRIWEATLGGRVLNTHQFKALLAVPSLAMVNLHSTENYENPGKECSPQSIAFPNLSVLGRRHLITVNDKGLYVFDPTEVKVILWNEELKNTLDWSSYQDMVYILGTDGQLIKVELVAIAKIVTKLVKNEKWKLAAQLCLTFKSTICCATSRHYVPVAMVTNIKDQMEKEGLNELGDGLKELLPMLEDFLLPESQTSSSQSSRRSSSSYEMMENGIYIVKNKAETPPLYSQKVFSFLNQAEKYLDRAFSTTEDGLENTDIEKESNPPMEGQLNWPTDVLRNANNSANYAVTNHDLPELHVNGRLPLGDDDADAVYSEGGDTAVMAIQENSQDDLKMVHIATEAQSCENPSDDEPPVISKRNLVRQKSKGRKVRAATIELDDSVHKVSNEELDKPLSDKRNTNSAADSDNHIAMETSDIKNGFSGQTQCKSDKVLSEIFVDVSQTKSTSSASTTDSVAMSTTERPNLLEGVTIATKEESPRRGILGVKDKLSGSVKNKTKSLIQTIKEKKSRISPRLRHRSSGDMGTLVFRKDGNTDNYYIQEPKGGSVMSGNETEAELASDVLECPDIETITNEAHHSLQLLGIVCNPDQIKEVLVSWVNALHRTFVWHRDYWPSSEDDSVSLNLDGVELVTDYGEESAESVVNGDAGNCDLGSCDLGSCDLESCDLGNCDLENCDLENTEDRFKTEDKIKTSNNLAKDNGNCDANAALNISPKKCAKSILKISLNGSTCIAMDSKLQSKISELCCYCFEMDVYGDISSVATVETSGTTNGDSEMFLRTYYHLLEPYLTGIWKGLQKKITICEKWKNFLTCVKDSMLSSEAVFKMCEGNSQETVELLRSSSQEMGPELMVYLEILYEKDPLMMVRFSADDARNLVMRPEVKLIIDTHPIHDKGKYFCHYLEYYTDVPDKDKRLSLIQDVNLDPEMTLTWFESLLENTSEGAVVQLKCSCGMPSPQSHLAKWESEDLMIDILTSGSNSSQLMALCYKHGFWRGFLKLWNLRHRRGSEEDKTRVFPVILQLGDLKVFDEYEGLQPKTEEDWKSLLLSFQKTFTHDESDTSLVCLKCGKTLKPLLTKDSECDKGLEKDSSSISWDILCYKMLLNLGPDMTMKILSDFRLTRSKDGLLPLGFYTECATTASLKQQQSKVTEEMMEKLQRYSMSSSAKKSNEDNVIEIKNALSYPDKGALVLENNDINCGICGLGFRQQINHLNAETKVFPCGHVFHDCCIDDEEACPACD